MVLKKCSCCQESKEVSNFHKNKNKPDGFATECKLCRSVAKTQLYHLKTEFFKEQAKMWYDQNKHIPSVRAKRLKVAARWRLDNKERRAATEAKRRARKLQATPLWLSDEQQKEILLEYSLAQWTSSVMGEEYHVDHIVPLRGKKVCGLHVPWNLQVIPAITNISKGNRYAV